MRILKLRGRNQTPIFCLPSGVRWCRWRAGCWRGMRCHGDVESASVADGSQSRPLPAGSAAHARRKRFRAGTVFRNGPQAHGSRANRATTATPVTTRACRTSAANHGCLVSCAVLAGGGDREVRSPPSPLHLVLLDDLQAGVGKGNSLAVAAESSGTGHPRRTEKSSIMVCVGYVPCAP